MKPRSLSHRAPLLGLLIAWGAGSVLAHATAGAAAWGTVEGARGWALALCAVAAVAGVGLAWLASTETSPTSRRRLFAGVCVAVAAAGALRTAQDRARPVQWDALELPPREARLTLEIERLFAPAKPEGHATTSTRRRADDTPEPSGGKPRRAQETNTRVGGLARVVGAEPHLRDLVGQRVQFAAAWPAEFATERPATRGVRFTAVGLLRRVPARPEPRSFDQFLADEGANFSFVRARVEGAPTAASAWARACAAVGTRLEAILRTGLADNPRQADLHVAMLLGQKQELSEAQEEMFVRSGTMHLFAISGLHVSGIALAVHTLLGLLRLPRAARFVAGTAVLWMFVQITGAAPSAIRAFWMITCLLGARELRVPSNGVAALTVSALGVLVVEPHQLFSAGFQLSYGIVAALLLYGVPLQERWKAAWRPWALVPPAERRWWQRLVDGTGCLLIDGAALGLASTLVSTPLTLAFFGLLTPGGFFVNLVLIPVSGLVLFAGVGAWVAGAAGLTPLVVVFNHAAALVLWAMEGAVAFSNRVPGAAWAAEFRAPWMASAATAGLLALLMVGYVRGWRPREGGFWAPWALLALGLVLGVRSV